MEAGHLALFADAISDVLLDCITSYCSSMDKNLRMTVIHIQSNMSVSMLNSVPVLLLIVTLMLAPTFIFILALIFIFLIPFCYSVTESCHMLNHTASHSTRWCDLMSSFTVVFNIV